MGSITVAKIERSFRMKTYKPTHFRLEELVPRTIFEDYGDQAWEFLDSRLLYTIDCLREVLAIPLVVNTWLWNGDSHFRGYRPRTCEVGAANSQHRHGRACDILCPRGNINSIRLKIIELNHIFPYLAAIEDKVSWIHVDVRNCVGCETSIKVFKQ